MGELARDGGRDAGLPGLGVSPAMEAGIDNHLWTLEEIADLADNFSN